MRRRRFQEGGHREATLQVHWPDKVEGGRERREVVSLAEKGSDKTQACCQVGTGRCQEA